MGSYLDVEIVNRVTTCGAWSGEGLGSRGGTFESCDALLESCDLSFLLFKLSALFLDFLMRDGLSFKASPRRKEVKKVSEIYMR